MQVVVGNLNLIRRLSSDNDKITGYALAAEQAAKRGSDLTGSLLAYARRQAQRTERMDVNRLLKEFEPLLLRTLGGRIEFRMDVSEAVPVCEADPAHFQSAILNLVINARDAMPNGGVLSSPRVSRRWTPGISPATWMPARGASSRCPCRIPARA